VIKPRYLLDTDTLVHIRRGRLETVQSRFRRLQQGEAVLSVVTYGELVYGIKKKEVGPEPLRRLHELTQWIPVLPLSIAVADAYGSIRAALSAKGAIIGANDLWIAAHAFATGLTVVTNNEREFRRVPGLKVENWTK
jgi:tRNA(fMet)-specific endonuclease VapC